MNVLAEEFAEWAKKSGWGVVRSNEKRKLPKKIIERYKKLPKDWLDFAQYFEDCVNGDNNIWFLCPYNFEDDSAFRWNEFELISLEAAEGDEDWQADIREFWDNYLPIAMSVGGDYHYYAICTKTGEVFEGWDPEFEEPEICTASFTDFITRIISGEIKLI